MSLISFGRGGEARANSLPTARLNAESSLVPPKTSTAAHSQSATSRTAPLPLPTSPSPPQTTRHNSLIQAEEQLVSLSVLPPPSLSRL